MVRSLLLTIFLELFNVVIEKHHALAIFYYLIANKYDKYVNNIFHLESDEPIKVNEIRVDFATNNPPAYVAGYGIHEKGHIYIYIYLYSMHALY